MSLASCLWNQLIARLRTEIAYARRRADPSLEPLPSLRNEPHSRLSFPLPHVRVLA